MTSKKLFDHSPEMTDAANANVNAAVQGALAARPEAARPAAVPRGRDIMSVAEREAARPAAVPRGRDVMPVAERGRLVEAARPEAAAGNTSNHNDPSRNIIDNIVMNNRGMSNISFPDNRSLLLL